MFLRMKRLLALVLFSVIFLDGFSQERHIQWEGITLHGKYDSHFVCAVERKGFHAVEDKSDVASFIGVYDPYKVVNTQLFVMKDESSSLVRGLVLLFPCGEGWKPVISMYEGVVSVFRDKFPYAQVDSSEGFIVDVGDSDLRRRFAVRQGHSKYVTWFEMPEGVIDIELRSVGEQIFVSVSMFDYSFL